MHTSNNFLPIIRAILFLSIISLASSAGIWAQVTTDGLLDALQDKQDNADESPIMKPRFRGSKLPSKTGIPDDQMELMKKKYMEKLDEDADKKRGDKDRKEIRNKDDKKELTEKKQAPEKKSLIEKMYHDRYSANFDRLEQYGYGFFDKITNARSLPVGKSYRVGPGDSLALYFWGEPVDILGFRGFYSLDVDRDGKIFVQNLGVFYVWGLEVDRIKELVRNALSKKFRKFEIEVTLGNLREFPVYVSGYVRNPGIIMATGMNNILDVIAMAGGIEKNGSLRMITIKSPGTSGTKRADMDLYELFIKGEPVEMRLSEGDSVFVGSIGKTAGISGIVKRPAIYEMKEGSVNELLSLAGGILPTARSQSAKIFHYKNDRLEISEGSLNDPSFLGIRLKDGDHLAIDDLSEIIERLVTVKGFISYPGTYPFIDNMKLSQIISKIRMKPDTNMHTAEILRDRENKVINFSPLDVLTGKFNVDLNELDVVMFYPKWMYMPIQVAGEVENPALIPYYKGITLLDVLHSIRFKKPQKNLKAEIYLSAESKTVYLNDLTIRADKLTNINIEPGTRVLIKSTEENEKREGVTILGNVKKPGIFSIDKGETLYDILLKAGGYTEKAFPKGLIFIRKSARMLQEEQLKISFMSMQENISKQASGLMQAGTSEDERLMLQMTLSRYEQTLNILKEKSKMSMGRMSLEIPETIDELKNHPDNLLLSDEDYIYVPREPNYVLILGDVYNQMSIPHTKEKTVGYYINQMGGFQESAGVDSVYIIKSNGKIISKTQFSSIFNLYLSMDWEKKRIFFSRDFNSMTIEQGDTIVVPTELKIPTMWRPLLKDLAQIMFQTISTAVLASRL